MKISRSKHSFNFALNVIMLLIISSLSFFLPINLLGEFLYESYNSLYQVLWVFGTLIINEVIFITYSEFVKIYCGNGKLAKKNHLLYAIFFKNKPGFKAVIIIISLFDVISTLVFFLRFNKFAMVFALLCICLIYTISSCSFCLISQEKVLYCIRDFLVFRPIPLITTPFSIAIFCITGVENNYSNILMLLINLLIISLYYYSLKKEWKPQKQACVAIAATCIVIFTMLYIFIFAEIKHTILENINTIFFAICYSLYTCLLYTLAYARLYPIRTESLSKTIEKYQIYMLAFFPLIAYPLFLHFTNESLYLCAFGVINLIAFNLVGTKSTEKNGINILLIIIFTFVAFSTLEINDATISEFDIEFSIKDFIACLATIFALVSAIKIPERLEQRLCKNLHDIEKKTELIIKIIKHPRYIASFSSSFSLLLLSLMCEGFIVNNRINSYCIIVYIVANVLIGILRVYLDYLKVYTTD